MLTHQWEGLPDYHDRDSSNLHEECSSVEDKTQRAAVQRNQSLTFRLQCRYAPEIGGGVQESQSPPPKQACISPQR